MWTNEIEPNIFNNRLCILKQDISFKIKKNANLKFLQFKQVESFKINCSFKEYIPLKNTFCLTINIIVLGFIDA